MAGLFSFCPDGAEVGRRTENHAAEKDARQQTYTPVEIASKAVSSGPGKHAHLGADSITAVQRELRIPTYRSDCKADHVSQVRLST